MITRQLQYGPQPSIRRRHLSRKAASSSMLCNERTPDQLAAKRFAKGLMKRSSGEVSTMAKVTSLNAPAKSTVRARWKNSAT